MNYLKKSFWQKVEENASKLGMIVMADDKKAVNYPSGLIHSGATYLPLLFSQVEANVDKNAMLSDDESKQWCDQHFQVCRHHFWYGPTLFTDKLISLCLTHRLSISTRRRTC